MKAFFVEARYKGVIKLPSELVKNLPHKLALFTTVQFIGQLPAIRKSLEKAGKEVMLFKEKHVAHEGQILGCTIRKYEGFDAFVYIGDGLFHPKALVLKNNKPVHAWNPKSKEYSLVTEKDVALLLRKKQASLMKFLQSKEIGILITTKPGQCRAEAAYSLEQQYPDKHFYFLLANTIDFSSLEDFPFIQCFVNTACPRIGYDDTNKMTKSVVNMDDLEELH